MKSSLSAWKYIRNNKKSVGVLVMAISLAFAAIYLIYFLLMPTVESFVPILLEMPKHETYIQLSDGAYGLDSGTYNAIDAITASSATNATGETKASDAPNPNDTTTPTGVNSANGTTNETNAPTSTGVINEINETNPTVETNPSGAPNPTDANNTSGVTDSEGIDKPSAENDPTAQMASYNQAREEAKNKFLEFLKNHEGIDDAYEKQVIYGRYQGVVGQMNYNFPLLDKEQIPAYLDHNDAKLIEGRLPEEDGEVALDKKIMVNQKLKIGDYYLEEIFGKNFKIVGILKSDHMTCVGTPHGYANTGWYIVILCDEKTSYFQTLADEYGLTLSDADYIDDMAKNQKVYGEEVRDIILSVVKIISMIVGLFLAFAVTIAYISKLRNRINEYCLYASIGYSRKSIYGMMLREMLISFGFGGIMGLIFSIAISLLLKFTLLDSMGLMSREIYPEEFLKIGSLFILIIGVLQLPVLLYLRKIRTIDEIED